MTLLKRFRDDNLRWVTPHRGSGPVLLLFPGDYRVMAASLGIQAIFERLSSGPFWSDLGFFESASRRVQTFSGRRASSFKVIGVSVAYELQIPDLIAALAAAGVAPLAAQRGPNDPLVIAGGPLSRINPAALLAIADALVVGEGEEIAVQLFEAGLGGRAALAEWAPALPGVLIDQQQAGAGPLRPAAAAAGPARSALVSQEAIFKDMFLVEIERGCPYACKFCCVGHWPGKPRYHSADQVLAAVPDTFHKVGLVGAAVTDHPQCEQIVEELVARGHQVSLSSMRADKVTRRLLTLLARGGLASVTVAADGASQRLRDLIKKQVERAQLLAAMENAAASGMRAVKLYAMLGLPGEGPADLQELVDLVREMSASAPRIKLSLALSPFVPKPGTPLEHQPLWDEGDIKQRIRFVRSATVQVAQVQVNSVRQAAIEYHLARAAPDTIAHLAGQMASGSLHIATSALLALLRRAARAGNCTGR